MIRLEVNSPSSGWKGAIGDGFIVKDSISIREELMNGLRPSSNMAALQVSGNCPLLERIIAEESDIAAVLKDGDDVIFTGYLSTNWNWSVTASGIQAVSLTIEDVGTRLFSREFIGNGAHLFDCTVHEAVEAVCLSAGVAVSPECIMIPTKVFRTVEAGETCREILSELLHEVGCVYRFDRYGRLLVHEMAVSMSEEDPRVDGDSIIGGISVKKSVREYRGARVSYGVLSVAPGLLVYRNTTGQDSTHPYCHMAIPAGYTFDGAEIYPTDEEDEHTPPRITACNADGDPSVSSGEIVAVEGISYDFTFDAGYMTAEVESAGGPYLYIKVRNASNAERHVTRLDVRATATYRGSTGIIRTGEETGRGEVASEELSWIHDKSSAGRLANLLSQYYRHSSSRYVFSSMLAIPTGTVVRLTDDIHSGLDASVLIVKRGFIYGRSCFSYEAVGISQFRLDEEVVEERIYNSFHPLRGPAGKDGEDAIQVVIISSNGMIFRSGDPSFVTTLEARVFQGGKDVTSLITGDHFRWTRNSGDETEDRKWNNLHYPLTGNTLDLTLSDIGGRCSFFAEYIE